MKLRKYWLIVCLFVSLPAFSQKGYPPPCGTVEEIKLDTNAVRRKVLSNFISASLSNQSFSVKYDKGIIILKEYTNAHNELCWLLSPDIDDSYKDNPPTRFSDFNGDIVLVYTADSTGNALKTPQPHEPLNQCLEQIIGDRVFTRPAKRSRWTSSVFPITNRKATEGARRNLTGNGGDVIIIFQKDGTYRKEYPA
ncbi:hypothetical protein [Fibrella aquatica]|uniref:hypothetical protein n=1 Tax=Fibrella aquatica TaxID=3242487 RepID=UPI00351FBD54